MPAFAQRSARGPYDTRALNEQRERSRNVSNHCYHIASIGRRIGIMRAGERIIYLRHKCGYLRSAPRYTMLRQLSWMATAYRVSSRMVCPPSLSRSPYRPMFRPFSFHASRLSARLSADSPDRLFGDIDDVGGFIPPMMAYSRPSPTTYPVRPECRPCIAGYGVSESKAAVL